jgi:hypothetical protein
MDNADSLNTKHEGRRHKPTPLASQLAGIAALD